MDQYQAIQGRVTRSMSQQQGQQKNFPQQGQEEVSGGDSGDGSANFQAMLHEMQRLTHAVHNLNDQAEQRWQKTEQRWAEFGGRLQKVDDALGQHSQHLATLDKSVAATNFTVAELSTTVNTLHDAQVFYERDSRRLLVGEPNSLRASEYLHAHGEDAWRVLLRAWAKSFRVSQPASRDWDTELATSSVFQAESFLRGRVVVELGTKLARDELCRQLAMSPERQRTWGALRIAARLTGLQEKHRRMVLSAFQQPAADPTDTALNRPWLPGRRVQIAADVAIVITENHPTFRINLGLSTETVERLIARALAVPQTVPASAPATATASRAAAALPPPAPTVGVSGGRSVLPPPFLPPPPDMDMAWQPLAVAPQPASVLGGARGRVKVSSCKRVSRGDSLPSSCWDTPGVTVLSWNCNGYSAGKSDTLQVYCDAAPSPPDIIVLVETHRHLTRSFLPDYELVVAAQAFGDGGPVPSVATAGQLAGGLAFAHASRVTVLATEVAQHFIVGVFSVADVGRCIVAGVYIPPTQSRFVATSYSTILDDLAETVSRLQLAWAVPVEAIMLAGDFNAHVARLQCGTPARGCCIDQFPQAVGALHELRFSSCQGSSSVARGRAFDRGCNRHNWLLLNGRCRSDSTGCVTCIHRGVGTVLDFMVVSNGSYADMRVLQSSAALSHYHHAVVGRLAFPSAVLASPPSFLDPPVQSLRPAPVRLTADQCVRLRRTVWGPWFNHVLALGGAMTDVDEATGVQFPARGNVIFEAFEHGLFHRLESIVGSRVRGVPISHRQGVDSRTRAVRQPWFTDVCRAAKAYWRQLSCARYPPDQVQQAKCAYRAACRKAKSHFFWSLERFRVKHEAQFWAQLKPQSEPVAASLPDLQAYFAQFFSLPHPDPLPTVVIEAVQRASHTSFTVEEVLAALNLMRHNKSTGLSQYSADLFRGMQDTSFYALIAYMFDHFINYQYPKALNQLLLLPLYKGKGDKLAPSSYRPISLIPPLGRWFASCVLARLEQATMAQRAVGQSGFRRGYRVEDNCFLLQTMFEWASARKQQVYVVFIDLSKAYDSVVRSKLFLALVSEWGIDTGLIKALVNLYEGVSQQVVVGGQLSGSFAVQKGVRQGCPASPLVFSLYIDRLETYIRSNMGDWTYQERQHVILAGMSIPILLYADDIALVARSHPLTCRLLRSLHNFCIANSLTVNIAKSCWLLGGYIPRDFTPPQLYYTDIPIQQVKSFTYLGLKLSGHSLQQMVLERLQKTYLKWSYIRNFLIQQGWKDRATKLLLFDTYVRSCMLYGCAVWGSYVLPASCDLSVDRTEKLGSLYRGALRCLLGIGKVRNEILYILSGRFPLQLHVAKSMWRFAESLAGSSRLAGQVARWAWHLDDAPWVARLSVSKLQSLRDRYPDIPSMYAQCFRDIRDGLRASDRLEGRTVLTVWESLLTLLASDRRQQLVFPPDMPLQAVQAEFRSFSVRVLRTRIRGQVIRKIYPGVRASWLQLSQQRLAQLVSWLYDDTRRISAAVEAQRFALLATSTAAVWSPRFARFARLIELNGFATCLWCDAYTTLHLMECLWAS